MAATDTKLEIRLIASFSKSQLSFLNPTNTRELATICSLQSNYAAVVSIFPVIIAANIAYISTNFWRTSLG